MQRNSILPHWITLLCPVLIAPIIGYVRRNRIESLIISTLSGIFWFVLITPWLIAAIWIPLNLFAVQQEHVWPVALMLCGIVTSGTGGYIGKRVVTYKENENNPEN